MEINALTAAQSNASNAAAASTTSSANVDGQRNMFMTLLVAQLKNQDPLSPQDSTAFVAQLAQFNSLDQLVGIRQSIEDLAALLHNNQSLTQSTNKI